MAGNKSRRGGQSGRSLRQLNRQYQQNNNQEAYDLQGVYAPGYDAGGNPQLLKWQGQEDDKAARFLAKVHNDINPQDYNEGYRIYDGDYQRFVIATGLNDKPTVLSDSEFDRVVQQNNLQVLWRGESGQNACDRFMEANTSHTGVGFYGDGYYFSQNESDASSYAYMKGMSDGRYMKMALAPTARCITYDDLVARMAADPSARLTSALNKAGSYSGSGYSNDGESQYALKLGYNVIVINRRKSVALTRDAFIVSDKTYKPY